MIYGIIQVKPLDRIPMTSVILLLQVISWIAMIYDITQVKLLDQIPILYDIRDATPILLIEWLQVNIMNCIMLYPSHPINLHAVESVLALPHTKFVNTLWQLLKQLAN